MASAQEYAKWIVDNQDKQGTPEFETVAKAYQMSRSREQPQQPRQPAPEPAFEREARETLSSTPAERLSANPIVRTLTTAARPIMAAQAMIERPFGITRTQERMARLDEMQQRGAKALGFGPVSTAAQDVSGSMLSPVMGVAMKLPAAATVIGRTVQGAELGGLAGLTAGTPDPLAAGAAGAAVGGAIPLVTGVVGKLSHIAKNILRLRAIQDKALLEAAGV